MRRKLRVRIGTFVACIVAAVALFATPAAAYYAQGTVNLPGCPSTSWYKDWGPGFGDVTGSDYPYCWSEVKIYYADGSGQHVIVGGWYQVSASLSIPAGATFLYGDFNFWNTSTGQIWGYRK